MAGAAVLSWSGAPTFDSIVGPLAIVGACVAWGLDNNLTRKVSPDPLQIAMLKGLIAGPFNLILGLSISREAPSLSGILLTGTVGFLGYGVSVALFVVALRDLGTARTGASRFRDCLVARRLAFVRLKAVVVRGQKSDNSGPTFPRHPSLAAP